MPPLLHVKLAVRCGAWWAEDDFGEEIAYLTTLSVWMGSANWTESASYHIEFGAWSTDEQLCATALAFMTSVIRASEPLSSLAPGPLPELVPADWDDDAFAWYYDVLGRDGRDEG
jgi:hypothetical protein